MTSYLLIDAPVSRWSSPEAIQAWIDKLHSWPEHPQRDAAIETAKIWLTQSEAP